MFSRMWSGLKRVSSTGFKFCLGNPVAWDRMIATIRDVSDLASPAAIGLLNGRLAGISNDEASHPMSGDTTADVGDLIERLRRGDDSARGTLLERVYHRLRRIAAATMQKKFPRLRARHEVDSVVDEAWVQLMKALETTRPVNAQDFYRLVFRKVRHVLLDMARRRVARMPGGNRLLPPRTPPALRTPSTSTTRPTSPPAWRSGPRFTARSGGFRRTRESSSDFITLPISPSPRSLGSWACTQSRSAGCGSPRRHDSLIGWTDLRSLFDGSNGRRRDGRS